MEPFEMSLGTVVKEILARPDKYKIERNTYNENTITATVYRDNVGIELTVKSNGIIVMVFDEELANGKSLNKTPTEYSMNNPVRKNLSHTSYGHKELDDFIHDFRAI